MSFAARTHEATFLQLASASALGVVDNNQAKKQLDGAFGGHSQED